MSNTRRVRPGYGKRAAHIAEAVITAGMVAEWRRDPRRVPPEWQDFWRTHAAGAWAPSDDDAPEPDADEEGLTPTREATVLDALSMAAQQLERAEQSVAATVAVARADGRSWLAIGQAIGMSKQGAAQRYGP